MKRGRSRDRYIRKGTTAGGREAPTRERKKGERERGERKLRGGGRHGGRERESFDCGFFLSQVFCCSPPLSPLDRREGEGERESGGRQRPAARRQARKENRLQ
eukprot:scaffold80392_cov13-Tisochrysis_lutea.AAC.1